MLGVKNRFAALQIDDDDGNDNPKGNSSNQNQSNSAPKKKDKKKKEDQDLRSLAFGLPKTGSGKQQKGSGQQHQQQPQQKQQKQANKQQNKPEDPNKNYDEWKSRDKQFTEEAFEHDLQQAILNSKLEAEQQTAAQKKKESEIKAAGIPLSACEEKKNGKKKKKKNKPQSMSLDKFQQLPPEQVTGSDDEETENVPPKPQVQNRIPQEKQDTHFFDETEKQALSIAEKERTKEQYQKAYAHQHVMQSKYMDQLKAKDREIVELQQIIAEQTATIKEVRQRNDAYCKLLGKGEMKDKAGLLEQVEELTQVKDELTEQVQVLTAELEKEKSKVHTLKLENDRLLKGKHGK